VFSFMWREVGEYSARNGGANTKRGIESCFVGVKSMSV